MCFPFVFSVASDYGMKLPILRSTPEDQILYQTERYNEETFGYEVPVKEEGDYVLVLKFAEVYFAQSQQKVRGVQVPAWPVTLLLLNRVETCEPSHKGGGTVSSEGKLDPPTLENLRPPAHWLYLLWGW